MPQFCEQVLPDFSYTKIIIEITELNLYKKTGSGVILVPQAYHYMSGQIYPPMAGLPFPKSHGCSTTPVEGILCLHFG